MSAPRHEAPTEPSNVEAACAGPALLVHVRSRVCAMPLSCVVEIMRPLPIEPVAGMPAFVLGLAVIRGAPQPVVDLGALLGAGGGGAIGRFVTLRIGKRGVALAVKAVLGVRDLAGAPLEEVPPLLREADAKAVAAIGALDADLLVLLRAGRVLPEEAWRALMAHAGGS